MKLFQSQRLNIMLLFRWSGILLAMIVAGLLGRVVSEVATRQINDEFTKLIVGIVIGLLIGLGVGILFRRAWGRLAEIVSYHRGTAENRQTT